MSKISLAPNAAGTAIFTIESPGTSTNRTLTLPDDTGTIVTNSGNQAGSFTTLNTSGQVVFNDSGADVDFRVEGDTNANLLFVDASADAVGIGTDSPYSASSQTSLSISGSAVSRVDFYNGATHVSNIDVYSGGGTGLVFRNITSLPMLFATNNTERARIDSSGVLRVGTTSNLAGETAGAFSTSSSGNPVVAVYNARNISGDGCLITFVGSNCDDTSSTLIQGTVAGVGNRFFVYGNGNVANTNNSYGAISDIKNKQDIVDAGSQWDDIKSLRVRKFRFKDKPTSPLQIGLVAQEAEEVSPGLIDESPDFKMVEVPVLDDEGNAVLNEDGTPQVTTERQATGEVTKSVKYSVLYMKAVKALQEAMERIETLEAKVGALEANNGV